jgi:hypothetical protein
VGGWYQGTVGLVTAQKPGSLKRKHPTAHLSVSPDPKILPARAGPLFLGLHLASLLKGHSWVLQPCPLHIGNGGACGRRRRSCEWMPDLDWDSTSKKITVLWDTEQHLWYLQKHLCAAAWTQRGAAPRSSGRSCSYPIVLIIYALGMPWDWVSGWEVAEYHRPKPVSAPILSKLKLAPRHWTSRPCLSHPILAICCQPLPCFLSVFSRNLAEN